MYYRNLAQSGAAIKLHYTKDLLNGDAARVRWVTALDFVPGFRDAGPFPGQEWRLEEWQNQGLDERLNHWKARLQFPERMFVVPGQTYGMHDGQVLQDRFGGQWSYTSFILKEGW